MLSSEVSTTNQPSIPVQLAPSRPRSRVVLVASSDSSLRERLLHSLSGLRWKVLEAPGGADAWVASQSTQLEALLVDTWLPDLDVKEFIEDFHREHPGVDMMMTDGTPIVNSPRSAYHQELLYALRRSQDGDTAAWNMASAQQEELPPQPLGRSLPAQVHLAHVSNLPGLAQRAPLSEASQLSAGSQAMSFHSTSPRNSVVVPMSAQSETFQSGMTDVASAGRLSAGADSIAIAIAGQRVSFPVREVVPLTKTSVARKEAASIERIPELVGSSAGMLEVSRRIRLVAGRTTPVLIEGPTGSGKELVAEALHRLSTRARKPFVAINCAAIPEALLEAELFGHTRGAFTGAVQGRTGRIESADGGTLFLDEIGEMPLALQSKLLRFFESGELQRIGDNETVKVDVRIVAATHQPLAEDAQKGVFRADLYYRLAVFLIRTPALIDHMQDLPQLVGHFLERMGRKMPVKRVDVSAMEKLETHAWPGSVRELEHVLERATILAGDEPVITAEEIDFGLSFGNWGMN